MVIRSQESLNPDSFGTTSLFYTNLPFHMSAWLIVLCHPHIPYF